MNNLKQLFSELNGIISFGLVNDNSNYYLNLCCNNKKLAVSYEEMLKEGFDIKEVFATIEKLAGKL